MTNKYFQFFLLLFVSLSLAISSFGQTIVYTMPGEDQLHEGTWLQWPHNDLYGPFYQDDVSSTFIEMTDALQEGEKVHIIVKDSSELAVVDAALTKANVPMTNIDFYLYPTDDVWSRDNGPMFVYDENNNLTILDWGFNGWGDDTPYAKCDAIPDSISENIGIPRIDLNGVVLEGGAIEHDGHGTMMATRSSVTHSSRNPNLTEEQIEDSLTKYMGITKFIWLDGVYGSEITDMHIDGFVKFANDSTIVTMNTADLEYWQVTSAEISIINNATNKNGEAYNIVTVPLTLDNVRTTLGTNLGYKGSYCNYYIGNEVVLVPIYNDTNDAIALDIIQGLYPSRTVVGVDVRNIYEYGGMVHCLTQQQPIALNSTSILQQENIELNLQQNVPNPFNSETTIILPYEVNSKSRLHIYNNIGQIIITKETKGLQQITLDLSDLNDGIYFYQLEVDGAIVGNKKMILQR